MWGWITKLMPTFNELKTGSFSFFNIYHPAGKLSWWFNLSEFFLLCTFAHKSRLRYFCVIKLFWNWKPRDLGCHILFWINYNEKKHFIFKITFITISYFYWTVIFRLHDSKMIHFQGKTDQKQTGYGNTSTDKWKQTDSMSWGWWRNRRQVVE